VKLPEIIQGGMGAAISTYKLAKTVSKAGQLGLVSGTALDVTLARRLQLGDPSGDIRRALEHFPDAEMARRILDKYFIDGGKGKNQPYRYTKMFTIDPPNSVYELNIIGNFVEVWLAKEGHNNPVGINFLEKIQLPNPSAIYGAMLASVDCIVMGAGIPREIPGILDKFVNHEDVSMKINVLGAEGGYQRMLFDPKKVIDKNLPPLKRPDFYPIIASAVLALTLFKKSTGKVNGFVVEFPTAGGHNAPPRGAMQLDDNGEPIYGEKDAINLEKIKKLGLPFWLAGSYGSPEKLAEAKSHGAAGIQVGTAFAYSEESGFADEFKKIILKSIKDGTVKVFTDPKASPTGFPFKIVLVEGTNSQKDVYEKRTRICDLGFLRHLYLDESGKMGYRCPSEPIKIYLKKGGAVEDTAGRKCLCNALMANPGYWQIQKNGYIETGLLTAGDDIVNLKHFLDGGKESYSAQDVLDYLLTPIDIE